MLCFRCARRKCQKDVKMSSKGEGNMGGEVGNVGNQNPSYIPTVITEDTVGRIVTGLWRPLPSVDCKKAEGRPMEATQEVLPFSSTLEQMCDGEALGNLPENRLMWPERLKTDVNRLKRNER